MNAEQENSYQPTSLFKGLGIVYVLMAVVFLLYTEYGIPLVQLFTKADEQNFFFYPLIGLLIIYFVLTIITTFTHREWFKEHWHVNLIVFILTGFLSIMSHALK